MNVGIRELKQKLSMYLALVRDGESLTVTDRGRPVARLQAVEEEGEELPESLRRLISEGRATPGRRTGYLPTPIKMMPGDSDRTSTDYVREQRGRY